MIMVSLSYRSSNEVHHGLRRRPVMPADELHERFEPLPEVRAATLARSTKKREQTTSTLSGFVIHEHLAARALHSARS
jgi:hypothetical protein